MKNIANLILRIPHYDKIHRITNFASPFILAAVTFWGRSEDINPLKLAIILFVIGLLLLVVNLPTIIKLTLLNLQLNPLSSLLFDQTTGIKNVALRAKTIEIFLGKISNIVSLGEEIGKSFYDDFVRYLSQKRGRIPRSRVDQEKLVKDWLQYDSGSGMGKFRFEESNEGYLLTVSEPFLYDKVCSTKNECFLCGYIQGFLRKLFSRKQVNVELKNKDQRECEFLIKIT